MKTVFLVFLLLSVCVLSESIPNVFINTVVDHKVDLNQGIVKHIYKLTVKSVDGSLSKYIFLVPKEHYKHMASIEAKEKSTLLTMTLVPQYDLEDSVAYMIRFPNPVSSASFEFRVVYYLTHMISFMPEQIKQTAVQLCVYSDNMMFVSPYNTEKLTTVFSLPSKKYESDTTSMNRSVSGKDLTYGPFHNVEPYAPYKQAYIHYPNTIPIKTFTKIIREIEISHWGNIAFEEAVFARNDAAPLLGEWSRHDFDNSFYKSSIKDRSWYDVECRLPRGSKDFYFRDVIGNISTSEIEYESKSTKLNLQTRFPLNGQWKTEFYFGYNLPIQKGISYTESKKYQLKVPFGTTITEGSVDELIVRVILPECVQNIEYTVPEGVQVMDQTVRYTYLDTKGRPVLEFKQYNVLTNQDALFTVSYNLSSLLLFREPLMCISAFFLLFLIASIYSRLNFSLVKHKVEKEKRD